MNPLFSLQQITKSFASKTLFEDLSLGVHERERVGILGVNGAGKSTLLKIVAGLERADKGMVHLQKNLNFVYVPQTQEFPERESAVQWVTHQLTCKGMETSEAEIQASIGLSMAGFEEFEVPITTLSGGWKKRLSLAYAIAKEPELLLLDEPTNHLDWNGIIWLESYLKSYKGTFVLISHDRRFLQNLCNRIVEINAAFPMGAFSFNCDYESFQAKKEEFLEAQLRQEASLSNKAKRELEWLRAGVKARTTKSQSRSKKAHQMLDDLQDLKTRNRSAKDISRIQIDATQRLAKKLIDLKNANIGYGDQVLIGDLDLTLGPQTCLGILGDNASGKTSLLKIFMSQLKPLKGEVYLAENLQIVYFEQNRVELPLSKNLMQYLADGGDYVMFRNASVHVAAYAARFLFRSEKMQLPISQLSGGEQARLLLAKILLRPADVLIFDEPTNDLDIETIEVLETILEDFPGLVILVSHDRSFLSGLCDRYLGLNGAGRWAMYASVDQWLTRPEEGPAPLLPKSAPKASTPVSDVKQKMTYKEKRFLETVETDISNLENELKKMQNLLQTPEVMSDHVRLAETARTVESLQNQIDQMYETWSSLDHKK
jgi:ATP-binding cassette subfamily F protein uup